MKKGKTVARYICLYSLRTTDSQSHAIAGYLTMMRLKIDLAMKDKIVRLLLRSIPLSFLAGPELYDVLSSIKESQNDVDQQVVEAVESLRKTSVLVSSLQQSVEERMTQLEALREEHVRYSELAQIEAMKAEPLLKEVQRTLGKEQHKERWIALAMHLGVGFLFFILGVAFSEPSKRWFDFLFAKISH